MFTGYHCVEHQGIQNNGIVGEDVYRYYFLLALNHVSPRYSNAVKTDTDAVLYKERNELIQAAAFPAPHRSGDLLSLLESSR